MIEISSPDKLSTTKYVLEFDYVNHRGEQATRKCIVSSITFGGNQWHPEKTWLLLGFCLDRMEYRTFAMKDMTNVKMYLG